jgi:selenocysteine-specific elongation factor
MVIDRAFDHLFAKKQVVQEQERIFLSDKEPRLSDSEQRAADQLAHLFLKAEFMTPRPDELPTLTGMKQNMLEELLVNLRHKGLLVELADQILVHTIHLEKSKQVLCHHLEKHGRIRLAEYKDLLNTSRKFAVPLLEYWDKAGLTKRVGDDRVLRT